MALIIIQNEQYWSDDFTKEIQEFDIQTSN